MIDFATKLEAPVAPYYLAHLQALGLPMQITAAQIAPQLTAAGIDVNQALADVAPQLTADESALLAAALTAAIPLNYFFVVDGTVSIEPTTGALIDVHSQQEGVAVQPDLSGVGALQPLLDKYAAIPSVKALSDGLAAMAARPPQLAQTFQYTQTPASSLSTADKARDQAHVMTIVTWWVPGAMGALGLALLGLGLFGWRGGRSRRSGAPPVENARGRACRARPTPNRPLRSGPTRPRRSPWWERCRQPRSTGRRMRRRSQPSRGNHEHRLHPSASTVTPSSTPFARTSAAVPTILRSGAMSRAVAGRC